ncbi:MAG TPA: GNAT family N-acetyltransferase, partial [Marmoricola sp.]|nr:GNAT family N-acetyltransferase [Marmoricola sp.]
MSPPPEPVSTPSPVADVLLHDGTIATIRRTVPDDLDALRGLHAGLGAESYRRRFFGTGTALAADYLHHLATAPDVIALVAEREGRTVALGTAEPVAEELAEVAFVVAEDCHGLGLGSLLLEHLAAEGRARGFTRFAAEVMSDNREMLDVFAHAGFAETHRTDRGTVELAMATDLTPLAVAAADAKERVAEAESLRPLLDPRSVAVVGVRSDGTGVGAALLRSIVEGGFDGGIAVVHPRLAGVEGIGVWRSFAEVPERVDLAVVAVPARQVLDVLSEAAAAGVRAAVVVSSGFEELGADGAQAQRAILDLARRHSMRVVGPNCLGIVSRAPGRLL